jgi:hypothetical protein
MDTLLSKIASPALTPVATPRLLPLTRPPNVTRIQWNSLKKKEAQGTLDSSTVNSVIGPDAMSGPFF